jgi:hypothetical protein
MDELFAYVEHSESNTMALVRRVSAFPLPFWPRNKTLQHSLCYPSSSNRYACIVRSG